MYALVTYAARAIAGPRPVARRDVQRRIYDLVRSIGHTYYTLPGSALVVALGTPADFTRLVVGLEELRDELGGDDGPLDYAAFRIAPETSQYHPGHPGQRPDWPAFSVFQWIVS
jgi:hypothetical protein